MKIHKFITDTIKMGKKGQITIPKIIRDEDSFNEGDTLNITNMPGGDIILQKKHAPTADDKLFEFLEKMPKINWRKAWEEIKAERKQEHR